MNGKTQFEWEEKNFDWLIDKFLKINQVADLWADFTYDEYEKSLQEPEGDR